MAAKHWIQKMAMKVGALRAEAGRAHGIDLNTGKIKESFLREAEHSNNSTLKRRAVLAETFRKMHHARRAGG